MSPVVLQAFIWAAVIAATLSGFSAFFVFSCRRAVHDMRAMAMADYNSAGWRGHGIKTPSTMRSEAAFVAGNRAAAGTAPWFALFSLAVVAALAAAASHGWRLVVAFIGGTAFFAWIGMLIWAAGVAGRAARAAPDDPSGAWPSLGKLTPADLTAPLSGRTGRILGWICAAAACGALVYLFGTIVDGYVLSIHHRLQPNPTFGVRDATAFSCLSRWYAAQEAGFTWLLYGYGTVLVVSLLMCATAAIKRRSPWDICLLVLGTVVVATVFVVAAGVHADHVAAAIPC